METVNQGGENNGQQEVKTFTQDELNAILNDRLGREKAKYSDYEELKSKAAKLDEMEEASKTELQKVTEKATALQSELDSLKKADEIRQIREKVAKENGVPANLLKAETEEGCVEEAKALLDFKKTVSPNYPQVRDAGEPQGTVKNTTRQQFAEWFNSIN